MRYESQEVENVIKISIGVISGRLADRNMVLGAAVMPQAYCNLQLLHCR